MHPASFCYLFNRGSLWFSNKFNKQWIHTGWIASLSDMAYVIHREQAWASRVTEPCSAIESCKHGLHQGSGQELTVSFSVVQNAQENVETGGAGFCGAVMILYWPILTNIRFYFGRISMVIWACWHQLVFFFWWGCKNKKGGLIKGETVSENCTKEEELLYVQQFCPPDRSKTLRKSHWSRVSHKKPWLESLLSFIER